MRQKLTDAFIQFSEAWELLCDEVGWRPVSLYSTPFYSFGMVSVLGTTVTLSDRTKSNQDWKKSFRHHQVSAVLEYKNWFRREVHLRRSSGKRVSVLTFWPGVRSEQRLYSASFLQLSFISTTVFFYCDGGWHPPPAKISLCTTLAPKVTLRRTWYHFIDAREPVLPTQYHEGEICTDLQGVIALLLCVFACFCRFLSVQTRLFRRTHHV